MNLILLTTEWLHHLTIMWLCGFSLYCVFSRADVLGGDAAPQGNVLRQARLLQGPAVTDRQPRSPVTADSPLVLVFLLIWSFQETLLPSLFPSCEFVIVWERTTVVVFNHHKDWKIVTSVITDLEFWWVSVERLRPNYISIFEICSTSIWHEDKLKSKHVGI